MRLALLALLTGCTPDDLADPAFDDWQTATAWLSDDVHEVPERTRVRGVGAARLSPEGPPLEDGIAWAHRGALTVVDAADGVRVVTESDGLRLLLWLERADLVDVVAERARAGARREDPAVGEDPAAGAWLPAGAEVEVLGTHGSWSLVAWSSYEVDVEAWLPADVVDQVWRPAPWTEARMPVDAYLKGDFELRDGPDGLPFAWRARGADLGVRVLDGQPGWVEVGLEVEGAELRGWVEDRFVADSLGTTVGIGRCGGGHGVSGRLRSGTLVPAGTWLHDGPEGPLVGVTTEDSWRYLERDGDWAVLSSFTPWGSVRLWLEP